MAGLNLPWLAAAIATLMALALPLGAALRGNVAHRLAALQMASVVAVWGFVELVFAFGQSSSLDLAVTLALLSLPGVLVLAVFAERWL
jgi:multisubunit Na+/H+ antiporter MnhF subunit